MTVGSKVACVNAVFSPTIVARYPALPVHGAVYTVRAVYLGRETVRNPDGSANATVGVLLEELHNPPDEQHGDLRELGFCSERFREVEEAPSMEVREAIAVN